MNTDQQPQPRTYTLPQVAAELSVSTKTVRRLIDRGDLKAWKTTDSEKGRWRITASALTRFIRSRTAKQRASL